MYPSGQMSGPYYDPWAGGNFGGGCSMPCCSHGYNYYYPPGPVMMPHPHPHVYPSLQPYAASPQVLQRPYHHVHHPHNHSSPGTGTPGNSNLPPDSCFPIQHQQQQYPVWRPPMVVPQSSCCCACPNHQSSYYGNLMSSGLGDGTKVSKESEDVKRVESVRPVMLNNGSNSSQPQQIFWIPPQYLNNLQQQDEGKGPQEGRNVGQLIPIDFDKLSSLHNKDSKPATSATQKDFPFPVIFMPHNSESSKGSIAKNKINEIEEKPASCNNAEPLKLLGDVVERMVPPEPVKRILEPQADSTSRGIQTQNEKVRVKDIPVKQAGEIKDTMPSTSAAVKSRSQSISPTKTSKLPPVCLRVDPLPRIKNGNGTPKQTNSPSHQRISQQPSQIGSITGDVNAKSIEESEAKLDHHNADNAKNVKVVEDPKDKPVSSINKNGKMKIRKENVNEGELSESVKRLAQPESSVGLEEGPSHGLRARKIISEETAAVRIQSAYRGYEERKWQSLQKLRQISKVRDQISLIKDRVRTLEYGGHMNLEEFERQRLIIGESIMSHLLTLDTIQGLHPSIRDIRKSVARELISLQEKLDLLHAQRLKEIEQSTDPGKRDAADNNEVRKVPSTNGTEEHDMNDVINAGNRQENKDGESDRESTKATVGSEDNKENLTKMDDSACSELHHEGAGYMCAYTEHTQNVTQAVANATLEVYSQANLNAGDEVDLKVKTAADEEKTESIQLDEQLLEGGNNCSVAEAVVECEPKTNCGIVVDDPQTSEMSRTVLDCEESNPLSCGTTVKNCEGLDLEEGMYADGKQASESVDESAVEVSGETIDHVGSHVEEQPEQQDLKSGSENLCNQKINASNTGATEEVIHKMEEVEVDEGVTSHSSNEDKPEEAEEIHLCKEGGRNEIMGQEDGSVSEFAGIVNFDISGIQLSGARSIVDADAKETCGTESEESVVIDNGYGEATDAAKTESELYHKSIEQPEAPLEDVKAIPGDNRAVIDEFETPRLSNVSCTSAEDADSAVLAEENDKLGEAVRKLLESEKDQLAIISTLNERLRNLEKKSKKKRNRKLKLQSGAMIKSAQKNTGGNKQNMPVCAM